MNPRLVPALPVSSPWHGWALPDIKHCEANLGGWITAPANTWSNLAYILVGLWLWRKARREGGSAAAAMGPIAVACGVGSFLFHGSYTFFFQVFDYVGMFLYILWVMVFALRRLGKLGAASSARAYWAGVAASVVLLLAFRRASWPIQALFGAQVVAAVALESWVFATRREGVSYAGLVATAALFALGQAFWHLDHADFFCRPEALLQGHAIWHVVTAFCFVTSYYFYRQFRTEALPA